MHRARAATESHDLAAALAHAVRGDVRFDSGSRALYATDASNYRQVPIGVVTPSDAEDLLGALAVCRTYDVPVLGRGAGTSLAGQCCNAAVVFDCSRHMRQVVEIDPVAYRARVSPGTPLDDLRAAAARHGLTFGPDPATHQYCTLGGMIGNNSCGVHSVFSATYGPGPTTAHNIESLDVVTYDGTRFRAGATPPSEADAIVSRGGRQGDLYRQLLAFRDRYAALIRREFPDIPRRVSGYNLPALLPEHGFHVARALVGSESTLALTLEATTTLLPARPHRVLVVLGYPTVFEAADHIGEALTHGPVGLEGMDDMLVRDLRRLGLPREHINLLPEGRGWLLVEFGDDSKDAARGRADAFVADVRRAGAASYQVIEDAESQHHIWELRESGLAATAHVEGQRATWPGWEDSAVPPARLGQYLRNLRQLFEKYDYTADLYGHFGQGCVHCRIDFDLHTQPGVARFRAFMEDAADLVVRYGGSLSGEHGDGQARGELLKRMFSPEMIQAFREYKAIWDPLGRMNPGKIIDANPLDSHLRIGPEHPHVSPATWFRYPADGGDFGTTALRCVGVGKCRKHDSGTMCPSYMVTHEEQHSTRGRARLLFEMLQGDPLDDGWQNEHVKEALDLCLACKGCKGECPVSVDMATYKAEFLAHYHERHWRPRTAWGFGYIDRWARLAAAAPAWVNVVTQTTGLRAVTRLAAGIAQERRIPAFAPQTFRAWFTTRPPGRVGRGPRVLLWPDTFNNHFHPESAKAAVDVLEATGFQVEIPSSPLCCGRPLYDFGLLDAARRRLTDIMDRLADSIAAGVPVVVLEPSCAAVFKDELLNFFPDDERARRLAHLVTSLGALLARDAGRLEAFRLERRAFLHGHCHQKALTGIEPEAGVLRQLGIDCQALDSGCCGMAGAFGFEQAHYAVSQAVGERMLLPAVRRAPADVLIVADGFSCREQIAQATDRRALHLADVLRMALTEGPQGPAGDPPERAYVPAHEQNVAMSGRQVALAAGVLTAAALLGWRGRPSAPPHRRHSATR
ncbi:MAG: FAD-binding and (Fe-S)-binding domain-containing protein [Vicinamibacterales bacterium]